MFDSTKDFEVNVSNLINHLGYVRNRDEFLGKIIRNHRKTTALESDINEYLTETAKVSSLVNRKFTYTNSIISLYGYLERFLEEVTAEFIRKLNSSDITYANLPGDIRRSHLNQSIELIKKIQRTKSHTLTEKNNKLATVLENTHGCVAGFHDYRLNEEAYSIHSMNFRFDTIHAYFCKIGLSGVPRMAVREIELKDAIARKHAIDNTVEERLLISLLTTELDDLAQRRNEIAHGSYDGGLESIELIIERAICLAEFGKSVGKVLTDYFHEIVFGSSSKFCLGLPVRTFNKINVFGFTEDAFSCKDIRRSISVGDTVFAWNVGSSDKLKYGKIISIVKDGYSTRTLVVPSDTEFAIKVDFDFNSRMINRQVYILNQ